MHEMSVALEVCRMAGERLGDRTPMLRLVALEVGRESGLEPDNLSFCLDALLAAPPFGAAHSTIRTSGGDALRLEYMDVDDGHPDN